MDTSTSKRTLGEVFSFADADLIANRKGELSSDQHKRLWDARWLSTFTAAPALLCSLYLLFSMRRLTFDWLVLTFLCIIASVFLSKKWLQIHHDLQDKYVGVASGQIKLTRQIARGRFGDNYERDHQLEVDGNSFILSKIQYDALVDGASYRIYYLPHSRTILSIVPSD